MIMLAVLALINLYLAKSLLYPPAAFSAFWSVLLLVLLLSGDMFYPVSIEALTVYYLGAFAFSAGGLIMLLAGAGLKPYPPLPEHRRKYINMMLDVGLLVLMLALPLFFYRALAVGDTSSYAMFFYNIRMQSIANYISQAGWSFSLLNNVVPFSILLSLAAILSNDSSRRYHTLAVIFLTFIFQLLTGAKTGATVLILALIGVSWIKTKRLNLKFLLMFLLSFFIFFSAITFSRSSERVMENKMMLFKEVQIYMLGGLVAFDRVAQDPACIPSTGGAGRFFLETASKIGADVSVPPLHAEYTKISPANRINVYTIYFSYFQDYGLAGVVVLMFWLGSILTWVYAHAAKGHPTAAITYGILFSGMILSCFGEFFYTGLNFLIKALLFTFVLYHWPLYWSRSFKTAEVRSYG